MPRANDAIPKGEREGTPTDDVLLSVSSGRFTVSRLLQPLHLSFTFPLPLLRAWLPLPQPAREHHHDPVTLAP